MKSIISGAIVATVVTLLAINVNAKSIGHFSAARPTATSDTGKMSKMSKKDTMGKMSKMSKMNKKKSKMAKKDTTSKM
jgi:hypothetical protein